MTAPQPTFLPEQRSDARRLTVVHVTAPTAFGGLERVVQSLAAGHQAQGHAVHVVGVLERHEADHPFLTSLKRSGVPTTVLAVPARAFRRERAELRARLRELVPDVVHTHGYRPDVVDAPAARRSGIPTVTTVHGFTGGSWKIRLYERLQLRLLRRFDAVVAVSRPLAEQLATSGVERERLHLIRNAWAGGAEPLNRSQARLQLGVAQQGFRVGWIGRLSQEKAADVLVDGLATLVDLPVAASVIGDGPDRDSLEQRAARLGLADRVTWHGGIPEAATLLKAFDVVVMSSRTEGTPIVLLEAMAAGVPLVTTAVGGVTDVVTEREAVLVPADDPRRLGEGVRSVFSDHAGACSRAHAAAERLRAHFALDPWLGRYESVYREVCTA